MKHIYEKDFVYTKSIETDIRKTFAKHGFVPPEAARKQALMGNVYRNFEERRKKEKQ